ncbi:MAG: ABC transporter permease [Actinomycetia bacterium]|nr:ABC transporter permease [Actinomycetes bacterium]
MTDLAEDPPPNTDPTVDQHEAVASHLTRTQLVLRRFWRPLSAKIGVAGVTFILLLTLAGPLIARWSYDEVDTTSFLTGPGADHWFGTTQGGRDVFAMTLRGLRQSLVIGFGVATIQVFLSAVIGAVAAYYGKVVDRAILWIVDLLLVIPSFLLIAIISQQFAGSRGSLTMFIVLLAGFGWMLSARVVRAMTKSVVSLDYINAAKFMSVPSWVIIFKHIIPNISSYLIVDFTLGIVRAVMAETILSFFGFGVQPPDTSLGTLLAEGAPRATTSGWVFLAPATVLVLTLLSINFVGDSLRDAIDPSSKSGGKA